MIEFPLLAPLVPPAICAGPHGQTLLGNTLPSRGPHADDQIDVSLPDGDRLTVLVHAGKRPVMVHLWHGLCGHAQSGYVLRATRWLTRAGYSVLRGNHRGCGAGRGKARLPYHSGRSGDLGHVVAFARKQWPDKKHIAVGFSLSGNALLLLVGRGGVAFPDAAISVNAPIDLALCSDRLLARENRLYDFRFARLCKRTVRERELDGLGAPPYKLPWNMTLQRFDDLYTAPAGGFADRDDYYQTCSAGPHLAAITTPTLMLTSADDPMVPVHSYHQATLGKSVRLHVESRGGHMGYLSAKPTPLGTRRWLDYAVMTMVENLAGLVLGERKPSNESGFRALEDQFPTVGVGDAIHQV